MSLDNLISAMVEIDKAQDLFAMSAAAELLLVNFIPVKQQITTEQLIEEIVDTFPEIREKIPTFDFSFWSGGTIIETVDDLITCGYLTGPVVDMNENSHELLEALIGRTKEFDKFKEDLEDEIECYAPVPNGRKKS